MMITRAALSGIQSAQIRFEKSADKVVNAFSVPDQTEQTPVPAIGEIAPIGVQSTSFIANEDVFIEESVNMMTASFAYKANVNVLKTWNETAEKVLSELSA